MYSNGKNTEVNFNLLFKTTTKRSIQLHSTQYFIILGRFHLVSFCDISITHSKGGPFQPLVPNSAHQHGLQLLAFLGPNYNPCQRLAITTRNTQNYFFMLNIHYGGFGFLEYTVNVKQDQCYTPGSPQHIQNLAQNQHSTHAFSSV